jgi:ABC-type sugar transport system permease subunit
VRHFGAAPYVFILPFVAVFAIFGVFAVFASLALSFSDWRGVAGGDFIGLDNYIKMANDPALHSALLHTAVVWLMTVPLLAIGSLVIAWLVESKLVRPLRAFFRTALFLPALPSLAVVSIIFLLMMDPNFGLIGQLFRAVGLAPVNIRVDVAAALPLISFIIVWKNLGYAIVIQLAALQAFPSQLREAAAIDGAGNWSFFWRILFPLSKPSIAFLAVLATIGVANTFEESYLTYGISGGPQRAGMVMGTYLYREAFRDFDIGYASAVAYTLAVVLFLVAAAQLRWGRAE